MYKSIVIVFIEDYNVQVVANVFVENRSYRLLQATAVRSAALLASMTRAVLYR